MKKISAMLSLAAVFTLAGCVFCPSGRIDTAKADPGRYGTISDNLVTVEVPAGEKWSGPHLVKIPFDLSDYRGKGLTVAMDMRSEGVDAPISNYNGVKITLSHRDPEGRYFAYYPSTGGGILGTDNWQTYRFSAAIPEDAVDGQLELGLFQSTGKAQFDLDSLKIEPLPEHAVPEGFRCSYTQKVADMPQLRGVMSPGTALTPEDMKTLEEWGANLVRVQLVGCPLEGAIPEADYDKWLDDTMDKWQDAIELAESNNSPLRFIVDLHNIPGGRDQDGDHLAFNDRERYEHFLRCWQRIAERFGKYDSVLAFDIINEPRQTKPAKVADYWQLQRDAAEVIRAAAPDKAIVVESNFWNNARDFIYLTPFDLSDVIYQVHMYAPDNYTHQGIGCSGDAERLNAARAGNGLYNYPGKIDGNDWNIDMIRSHLAPVKAFEQKYGARIYVGEFSAIAWAPDKEKYLEDCIRVFNENNWPWSYHAFREWSAWSIEHDGDCLQNIVPTADAPRKRVLLKAFKNEL